MPVVNEETAGVDISSSKPVGIFFAIFSLQVRFISILQNKRGMTEATKTRNRVEDWELRRKEELEVNLLGEPQGMNILVGS